MNYLHDEIRSRNDCRSQSIANFRSISRSFQRLKSVVPETNVPSHKDFANKLEYALPERTMRSSDLGFKRFESSPSRASKMLRSKEPGSSLSVSDPYVVTKCASSRNINLSTESRLSMSMSGSFPSPPKISPTKSKFIRGTNSPTKRSEILSATTNSKVFTNEQNGASNVVDATSAKIHRKSNENSTLSQSPSTLVQDETVSLEGKNDICSPNTFKTKRLEQLSENVFIVYATGRVYHGLGRMNRNMVIIRHHSHNKSTKTTRNELTLVNPIQLDQAGESEIRSLGFVKRIIRLAPEQGETHDEYYMKSFLNPVPIERWAPDVVKDASNLMIHKRFSVDDNGKFILPWCQVFTFEHLKESSLLVHCTSEHKSKKNKNLLIVGECLQSHYNNPFINMPVRAKLATDGMMKRRVVIPSYVLKRTPVSSNDICNSPGAPHAHTSDEYNRAIPLEHTVSTSNLFAHRDNSVIREEFHAMLKQIADFDQLIGSSGVLVQNDAKVHTIIAIEQTFPIW